MPSMGPWPCSTFFLIIDFNQKKYKFVMMQLELILKMLIEGAI